jgi:hypothetical protein
VPRRIVPLLLVVAAALAAWLPRGVGDYAVELQPAAERLIHGDLAGSAAVAPVYAGSLLPRLPAMWAADALGGGAQTVYRAGALVCLLALAALASFVAPRLRGDRAWVLGTLLGAPVVLEAVGYGHPEEVLAGVLGCTAILASAGGRPLVAGLLVGLAAGTKQWGVVALAPALVAAPMSWRARAGLLGAGAAGAALLLAPFALADWERASGSTHAAAQAVGHFRPQQLFWPFGIEQLHVSDGVTYVGHRAPRWVGQLSRPLIVALPVLLAATLWVRRRRAPLGLDALGILALALVARCALDPWDALYYAVPGVLALVLWEGLTRPGLPVLALLFGAGSWLSFTDKLAIADDARFAVHAAFVLGVGAAALWRLYAETSSATAASASAGLTAPPWRTSPGASTST